MSSPTTLALKINERWTDILLITELELQAMSTKPLKWLRHVAWCLYGTLGALHTIVDENLEPIFDEELVSGFASQYCYVSESDTSPRYLDPDLLKEYSETGGTAREKFRDPLLQRDGSCIFREANLDPGMRMDMSSYESKLVKGVHFIPHCKGDEASLHIFSLFSTWIRTADIAALLNDIDDLRNGALMWSEIHEHMGNGALTMLLVPNQYMNVDDAPSGPSERLDWPPPGDDTEFLVPSSPAPTDTKTVSTDDGSSEYSPPGRTTPVPEETRNTYREYMQDIKEHEDLAKKQEETNAEQEAHREAMFEAEAKDSGYVSFTSESKVILQHLEPMGSVFPMCVPNNTRAALRRWTRLSPVALHATYGCAILNRFSVTRTARIVNAGATDGLGRKRRKDDNDEDNEKNRRRQEKKSKFSGIDSNEFRDPDVLASYYSVGDTKKPVTRSVPSAGNDPAPADMDAWDFLLSLHMPPEQVIAEHRAKLRRGVAAWADNIEPQGITFLEHLAA
ncbi:hypothetical protein GGX14DRAFT_674863 [Mycena pura]|uniref:HNH nuclease domain-containing protein n=1 Tax=Mycena pura TaxID=153505 RepID=A0AAD6YIV1_9AGAR|nr:hypothetical protein GGX14DRAFT_674863 [Mycena pura]